ncbi:MgtC/SapB family protein [Methylobacterium sp. WCS2018Hpa-22]|uniref:MgtC/SapB family protein n=1 Tax=Methylobacterium sp. WCS2018Hpa-22 TaxID=3073633 RepID=UPI0028897507|nr:MgtC/SapB family protein [Methylobacterium sp. WCS2018Hpa-22]
MIGNFEILGRLLVAALLGSAVGFERERHVWAAGMRTHMLVCVGSCLIVIVSAFGFSDILGTPNVNLDPSRMAAQVVSGIGFLGAGTIMLRGEMVKGLTTAAGLWAVAAIGLAAGTGLYVAATTTTVIVLLILAGMKPLEKRYRERAQTRTLSITAKRGVITIESLRTMSGPFASRLVQFVAQPTEEDGIDTIEVSYVHIPDKSFDEIVTALRAREGVTSVS